MCEVVGAVFHHQAMDDRLEISLAVALGEEGREKEGIEDLWEEEKWREGGREGGMLVNEKERTVLRGGRGGRTEGREG